MKQRATTSPFFWRTLWGNCLIFHKIWISIPREHTGHRFQNLPTHMQSPGLSLPWWYCYSVDAVIQKIQAKHALVKKIRKEHKVPNTLPSKGMGFLQKQYPRIQKQSKSNWRHGIAGISSDHYTNLCYSSGTGEPAPIYMGVCWQQLPWRP